jgi:hypothetical protein
MQGLKIRQKGTVKDLEKQTDLILLQTDYDIEALKDLYGKNKKYLEEFVYFFVKEKDGQYIKVYGVTTIPYTFLSYYEIEPPC